MKESLRALMGQRSQSRDRGRSRDRRTTAIAALVLGVGASVALGIYASAHAVTGRAPISLGFVLPGQMKVWFTRAAVVLAVIQLLSGLRIDGRIRVPRRIPGWARFAHRGSGFLAFLLVVPVAYDCVSAFGFQTGVGRVVFHATAGLVFFGAFAAKVVAVQRRRRPTWLIPVVGATLATSLLLVWLTTVGWPISIY